MTLEVMHKAVVKYRPTRPLPGEITSARINSATLPVKIEAARRAIAECEDLPELMKYKDQAEGLAAAVRTMKEVGPEMVRAANEMMADAWRRAGELLGRYSGVARLKGGIKQISERGKVARELGITTAQMGELQRIAAAPKSLLYAQAQKFYSRERVARNLPARHPKFGRGAHSDAMRSIVGARGTSYGLNFAAVALRHVPLDAFSRLAPEERRAVKETLVEIMELVDEMDRRLKS